MAQITLLPFLLQLGASGVKRSKTGCSDEGCNPHEIKLFEGQVGQESNLQPAVLEPDAMRSVTFHYVTSSDGFYTFSVCRVP